ncbi:MAG: class B sortase [Ruminococcus sp.]|nr:class B sortase [Ruminococcus sp.]
MGKRLKKTMKKKGSIKIGRIMLFIFFLAASAAAVAIIVLSKECGGSRDIEQAHVELPTTTTITETTTTTTTTETTTTTTTTTQAKIDYEMKLNLANVAEHKAVNPEVVGWIYIDGTVVDYPILKSTDNDKYIHLDWMGNYAYAGCIYEDFRGDIDDTDLTLLYGHNMANGSMFSAIKSYLSEEWGKEHKYFEIASEKKRYLYEVISANVLYGESGADFGYWLPTLPKELNMKKSDFESYIKNIKSTANVLYCKDSSTLPQYGDHIIALQTCNSGNNDGMRCVIFAKCLGER